MCGIAGIVTSEPCRARLAALNTARQNLQHRGPDGEGSWISDAGTAALTHTRLAVVDLAGGQQPIANERADVHVVFNGEIYNHVELRSDLERRGHRFRTRCDAEVLVHLYEQFDLDMFSRLNGMFAFALWDQTKERVVLARDRLGQKPLYCRMRGTELALNSAFPAEANPIPFPEVARNSAAFEKP